MELLKRFDWFKTTLVLLIVVLISMLFSKFESEKTQLSNIKILNSEAEVYKLKNGKLVISQKTLIYNNRQLQDLVISKDATIAEISKKFYKVKTVTKIITKTKLDTIRLMYRDTVPFEFDRTGSLVTDDYSIDYNSTQKGISIDNLTIPDSLTIVSGVKRKWFLGKKTEYIDVFHSNKFVNNEEVGYYELEKETKWYQTTLFKVGVGVLIGGILIK